jgi:guanine deaminase
MDLHLGQTLAFQADPFEVPPEEAARHSARGGVLVAEGRILAVGRGPTTCAAPIPRRPSRTTGMG